MTWTIIAVGHLKPGPEHELLERYRQRLKGALTIKEVAAASHLPSPQRKIRETQELLRAIPQGAVVVLLEERGQSITTCQLSSFLERHGKRTVAFVIGGVDGLAEGIFDRPDLSLALGKLTWPHMLVRVMIAEQIYRAHQLVMGHPYHRA